MQNIPQDVVDRISQLLGKPAQVHRFDSPDEPSGCMEWACNSGDTDENLAKVRSFLTGMPFMAYKRISMWGGSVYRADYSGIVVCPTVDQFQPLRFEMGDRNGWEHFLPELKELNERYGIDVTGVGGHSNIEFVLKTIPTGLEERRKLSDFILKFAPDVDESYWSDDNEEFVIDFDRCYGRVDLWWD